MPVLTPQEANALARFINRCGDRYQAETIPLGEGSAWVVLSDGQGSGSSLPPIIDVECVLQETAEDLSITAECRELLEAWFEEQDDDTVADAAQLRQELRDATQQQQQWNRLPYGDNS